MTKYEKVTKEQVLRVLINIHLDFTCPIEGVINLVNIASYLKTSRYQVKKIINKLKAEGLVELKCIVSSGNSEYDDFHPPYWGYKITEKAAETELYKQLDEESHKLFESFLEDYTK